MKELQVYKVTFSVKKRKSFQKRYMVLDLKGQSFHIHFTSLFSPVLFTINCFYDICNLSFFY